MGFSGYSEFRVFLKWEDEEEEISQSYIGTLTHDLEATLKHLQDKNFDDFFDAFHVNADDKMWLSPESRVQIW